MTPACVYCGKSFSDMNRGQKGNHRRWCTKNPRYDELRKAQSKTAASTASKVHGEFKDFEVECVICKSEFLVCEREKLFDPNEIRYCSSRCAHSAGGRAKSKNTEERGETHYTTIAFRHHERKCVVCEEINIVAVHHLNKNHADNRPENLIPLCPTHHQYMHSRHKALIEDKITEYVETHWK